MESVQSKFAKDKIPGPNGWPVEIFSTFLDVMGNDLLKVVEMSRTQGYMPGALKTTFISLIPKTDKLYTF